MSFLTDTLRKHVSVSKQSLTEISCSFTERKLSRKAQWVHAGDVSRELALIETGYLRMYRLDEGKDTTIWIGSSGKFVTSLSSFVDQRPSLWNIEALTDSKLHIIKRDSHFRLCEQFREWLEFENVLLSKALAALEYRNFELQKLSAENRYLSLFQKCPSMFLDVPAKYIASLLGISEETLSRLRKNRRNLS